MKERHGDLWTVRADMRIITTNGSVRRDGAAVMGRGCALQAKERYPMVPFQLGKMITDYGNHVHLLTPMPLISFPVKHIWGDAADLQLIRRSVAELLAILALDVQYAMVRPGCGNGHLSWEQVRPLLFALPDNVTIVQL